MDTGYVSVVVEESTTVPQGRTSSSSGISQQPVSPLHHVSLGQRLLSGNAILVQKLDFMSKLSVHRFYFTAALTPNFRFLDPDKSFQSRFSRHLLSLPTNLPMNCCAQKGRLPLTARSPAPVVTVPSGFNKKSLVGLAPVNLEASIICIISSSSSKPRWTRIESSTKVGGD